MISKVSRAQMRQKKHRRLRNHIVGTAQRPRLCVFRSNNHMYAQIIDDTIWKYFSFCFYSSERSESRA